MMRDEDSSTHSNSEPGMTLESDGARLERGAGDTRETGPSLDGRARRHAVLRVERAIRLVDVTRRDERTRRLGAK